jgi:ribosomal-protein-alanine N-acetyltransferase
MKFQPFPELKTERLLLRKIKVSDVDEVLFLRSDKTVNKFIERPENRKTKNKADALKFIEKIITEIENNKSISWEITFINNPKMIGSICLWNFSNNLKTAEVGYALNPEFQNQGIMHDAINCVIDYGFNKLNLDKIEAFTHSKNEPSKRLLEKNGFTFIDHRMDEGNASNIIFEIEKPLAL